MKLPKIDIPLYELILPSTKEKIKYRPFTVKEEKILLVAQETKDINQILLAISQIVNNCLIDKSVEDLAMFDLEYILLLIRSKSVDNNVNFTIRDNETEEKINLELDLNNVQFVIPDNHTKEIRINDEYILYMRYPSIIEFNGLIDKEHINDPETNYQLMLKCMDKLVNETSVFKFKDFSEEEIDEFAQSLTSDTIRKIKTFFETMPKLRHELKYINSNKHEKTFIIEGLNAFFI